MSDKPTYPDLVQRIKILEQNEFMREKAQRASEKRFATIFHSNPAAIALTRLDDNRLIDVNAAWQDLTGYTHSEAVGHTTLELDLWVDHQQREQLIQMIGEHGKARVEMEIRHKSGMIIQALMSAEWVDLSGAAYLLSMAQDITSQKRAEKELRESEAKYRRMMESFADPLYICSPDFSVEYMNPAMARRIGRDATGEKCHWVMHGLDSRCDWCIFDKVASGETIETTVKSPLDDRHYRVSNMPIQNTDGSISKMTIFRDITDFLKAVDEKENAQKLLTQAQKMESIGNLAGGIAHDFNNILSSIIGFTELALEDAEEESMMEENLQEVFAAGTRAKELVAQILAFARQSEEELTPIQVELIVKEVIQFIRSSLPATIEIKSQFDSDALIMGNPTQIHQIMMNLCTNAAHAMEDAGGTLSIGVADRLIDHDLGRRLDRPSDDTIEITVSDTGTGISPGIIESIFEPYFTTKDLGEGTGMGLAMVKGIVERYGGRIGVDSAVGKGTTFTITLPVTRQGATHSQTEAQRLPTGTERILLIDDVEPIAKMQSQGLERLGYTVVTRSSSIAALELFRDRPDDFDLVITDMTMPTLTGDQLTLEMMKIRPDIPVILCTGYSKKISDEAAFRIGFKALLYKPILKPELALTVRRVLDGANGLTQSQEKAMG